MSISVDFGQHRQRTLLSAITAPRSTPIIGRDEEISTILRLLSDAAIRLLVLTGPAGVGKTRLAGEVVSRVQDMQLFADGTQAVSLETLRDAGLVLPMIASAMGLDQSIQGDALGRLIFRIADLRMLLVLDNAEQVVESAPLLVRLLADCPRLTILVTSRRALHIRDEQIVRISPLALPSLEPDVPLAEMETCPSVQVFLQFARLRNRNVALTREDAPIVGALCHHLDGLPLALELAAARMDVLTPLALLRHVRARADVLSHGPVDLPVRHRRMHEAIAWSYDLLTASEQRCFLRLSVLEGSFDVSAARSLGAVAEDGALDLLTELARSSLILPVADKDQTEPRFRILETVRAFGLSVLEDTGEIDEIRRLYTLHMLELVRAAVPAFSNAALETNAAGIRAVLTWSWREPGRDLFLQLVTLLEPYWRRSGHLEEGWLWMERAVELVRVGDQPIARRIIVLLGAATLARRRADFPAAECLAREGLEEARKAGDERGMARALNALGAIATQRSDYVRARCLYQDALEAYAHAGDHEGEAVVRHNLALITLGEYEIGRAIRLWEEAIPVARRTGSAVALTAMLRTLGTVRLAQGRTDSAARLLGEAVRLSENMPDPYQEVICRARLSRVAMERGRADEGRRLGAEALRRARELGEPMAVVLALLSQAAVEQDQGELGTADLLLAEAYEIASWIGVPLLSQPVLQSMGEVRRREGEWRGAFDLYEESLRCWLQGGDVLDLVPLLVPFADVALQLGEDTLVLRLLDVIEGLQSLGLSIPLAHQDIHRALRQWSDRGEPVPRASLSGSALRERVRGILGETTSTSRLSGRERAVLSLLANGHTNTQMAERLFVSPHTINTHVRRIYQKLGVNTRSAATRVAIERGMVADTQGVI